MANKKIKGKAKEKKGVVTVKILMSHPMESGFRKDKKTGKYIPAHYIEEVVCSLAGETLYTAYFGGAISKNPYLSFRFKGPAKGEVIETVWKDSAGESAKSEFKVK